MHLVGSNGDTSSNDRIKDILIFDISIWTVLNFSRQVDHLRRGSQNTNKLYKPVLETFNDYTTRGSTCPDSTERLMI